MVIYRFVEWRDEVGNVWSTPSISVFIDRDKILTAYYEEVVVPTYILTVQTTVGGITDPTPGNYEHDEGASVTVTATPDSGYDFSHWILDGETRTEKSTVVIMDKDYTLTAYFEVIPPPQYTLTISEPSGGSTNPPPGPHDYNEGTVVIVSALPLPGYVFEHWIFDGTIDTTHPISVLMDRNHSLLAVFAEVPPECSIDADCPKGYRCVDGVCVKIAPCFIATACYGSPLAPQLYVLRRFKNRCLPNPIVKLYYRTSPPMAKYISEHTNVRHIVKQLLEPLIKTIRRLL